MTRAQLEFVAAMLRNRLIESSVLPERIDLLSSPDHRARARQALSIVSTLVRHSISP